MNATWSQWRHRWRSPRTAVAPRCISTPPPFVLGRAVPRPRLPRTSLPVSVGRARYASVDGGGSSSLPPPGVYCHPSLSDYVTATYPSSDIGPWSHRPCRFVAVFACYDGGAPFLTFLQADGNEAALERLHAIAEENNDEDFLVRVFIDHALTRDTVHRLMQAKGEVKGLRALLTQALPDGPARDGWVDRDMWTVAQLLQSCSRRWRGGWACCRCTPSCPTRSTITRRGCSPDCPATFNHPSNNRRHLPQIASSLPSLNVHHYTAHINSLACAECEGEVPVL